MKLSVIIITLNEEKYVGGILGDLLTQTFKDFEVLVVDANSKDKTAEVVKKFEKGLNLRFVLSPQRGIPFQRNYGASLSTSENLVFFDADVRIDHDFLEKIAGYVSGHDVDFLTSWNIPLSNKLVDKVIFKVFNVGFLEVTKRFDPGAVGTFMFVKKTAFEKVGGFEQDVVLGEDFELFRRLHRKGYKYSLLKDPQIFFSTRRLEEEGRVPFILKNLKGLKHYYTKGKITSRDGFKAEFGNHK
jgi:glycosyltransferase involved in cell wall biosynthesis